MGKQDTLHVRMVFGKPDCRPSFWPQEEWAWENLNTSLSMVKDYSGPGTFTDLIDTCIQNLFAMHGKDSETYISEDQNESKIKSKLRVRSRTGTTVDDGENKSNPAEGDSSIKFKLEDDPLTENETNIERGVLQHFEELGMEEYKKPKLTQETVDENQVVVAAGGKEIYKVDLDDVGTTRHTDEEEAEDYSPVSITINSRGHEPIQITLNKLKRKRPHY